MRTYQILTKTLRALLTAAFAATLAAASSFAAQTPVQVHTALSRTAVWIGDHLTYTIEFECEGNFDVVDDDVSSQRIRVDGGEIVGFDSRTEERDGKRLRRIQYTIATYSVTAAAVSIPALPVRYYARQAGGDTSRLAPAGTVTVPAAIVGIRSSLASPNAPSAPRVPAALQRAPAFFQYAQPVGFVVIALVAVRVLTARADLVQYLHVARSRWQARQRRRAHSVSLEDLRSLDPGTDPEVAAAYGRLDEVVRAHLEQSTGVPARALTTEELRAALESTAPALPHADIESLLARCEDARYSAVPPPRSQWPGALDEAAAILRARPR
jgi:hypothetical protein